MAERKVSDSHPDSKGKLRVAVRNETTAEVEHKKDKESEKDLG